MSWTITAARSDADYAAFGDLVLAYEAWLRDRFASVPDLLETVREHQDLDGELADLRLKYGPPNGVVLLARSGDSLLGGVACRDLGDGTCEMKRLFVREGAQGAGLGRALCERLLEHATAAGFTSMKLDTGTLNTEAIALYLDLGFVERDPYWEYPPAVAPHIRFFERPLAGPPGD